MQTRLPSSAREANPAGDCLADIFQRSSPAKISSGADLVTWRTYHNNPVEPECLPPPISFRHPRVSCVNALLAVLLFSLALLARWPLIQRGETLLHPDEAIVGLMAQDIREGVRLPIYFYGQRYMGALEAYVVAACDTLLNDSLLALRLAPCLFFAGLVVMQFLILTRWFGRSGGLIGAAVLLFASPMFAQWSVSARGGYIEILLWGSALMGCYAEGFVGRSAVTPRRRFVMGVLVGSGFWVNPSILFFVAPIVLDVFLRRIAGRAGTWRCGRRATLPVMMLGAVLILNVLWSVRVEGADIKSSILLDLLPRSVVAGLTAATMFLALLTLRRDSWLTLFRPALRRHAMLILGAWIGAAPAIVYVIQSWLRATPLEPSLPLGFRPLWHAGETLLYFLHGLPLLFGADPQPFLDHVTVGRDHALRAPHETMELLTAAARIAAIVSGIVLLVAFVRLYGRRLALLLSCRVRRFDPVLLLVLGATVTLGLYLLGGCSCSFTTIRYLVPIWAFTPGLIASIYVSTYSRRWIRAGVITLLCAWGVGQAALIQRIGAPHPLRRVADRLIDTGTKTAVADTLDAHLLSYLTRQRVHVAEYDPFWSRLAHYPADPAWRQSWQEQPSLVLNTHEIDRTLDWVEAGFPGPPPPETQRFLWPALQIALVRETSLCARRVPLGRGYEWIRLSRPGPFMASARP